MPRIVGQAGDAIRNLAVRLDHDDEGGYAHCRILPEEGKDLQSTSSKTVKPNIVVLQLFPFRRTFIGTTAAGWFMAIRPKPRNEQQENP